MEIPAFNEGAPETVNWRNNRLRLWQVLKERRDQDVLQALKYTTQENAKQYAAERSRAEIRYFLANVLRRASARAAATFMVEAPRDWFDRPEQLLDAGELVPRLIRRSYAEPSFAAGLQELEKEKAQIDTYWGPWIHNWMTQVEQETGVRLENAAETLGAARDSAAAAYDFLQKVAKYGPPIVVGVLVVGLAVGIARKVGG